MRTTTCYSVFFDCANVVSLLPPTTKIEESKETHYDVSLVVKYASLSTSDVPLDYFSSLFCLSVPGRLRRDDHDHFSGISPQHSFLASLHFESRRGANASHHFHRHHAGLVREYRGSCSSTIPFRCRSRAQIQFDEYHPHRSLVRSVSLRVELFPFDSQLFPKQHVRALRRCATYVHTETDVERDSLLSSTNLAQCESMLHAERHRFTESSAQCHTN